MKKNISKLLSLLLSCSMMMSLGNAMAYAEIPNKNITATLTMGAVSEGNSINSYNQWNSSGNIGSPGAPAEYAPIALEDDLFDKAYVYGWGGGGANYGSSLQTYMKVPLNIPEHSASDAIYVSFYYKSLSSRNGKTPPATQRMDHIRDNSNMVVNLDAGIDYRGQNTGMGAFIFEADDEWHKVEIYMPGDRFADNYLNFFHDTTVDALYFMVADVRAGVVKDAGAAYNNDKAYTEIGWLAKEINTPSKITVNGSELDLADEDKVYTFEVDSVEAPVVEVEGSDYIVTKVTDKMYEINPVAYGYDKSKISTDKVDYRQRGFENGSGTWIYNSGNINVVETYNGDLMGDTYTIKLKTEGDVEPEPSPEVTPEPSPEPTPEPVDGLLAPGSAFLNKNPKTNFKLGAVSEGNSLNSYNQWNSSGNIGSPNAPAEYAPIALEDDLFDKAYVYGWGGGQANYGNNLQTWMQIPLNIPEHTANDGIYVSFYYKSLSSRNGKTPPATQRMDHIRDSANMAVNLDGGLDYRGQNTGMGAFIFEADDEWHKIEIYMPGDRFADNTLRFFHDSTVDALYFMIADVRAGVLYNNEVAYNNDAAYTDIGWFAKSVYVPSGITVNGEKLDIASANEFTVKTQDFSVPDVDVTGADYIITKLTDSKYEITATAFGYDKSKIMTDKVDYRQRGYDNGRGVWIYNDGPISVIETYNGDLMGDTYTINLVYDEGFYVDGKKVDEEKVPAGKVYSYRKSIEKPASGVVSAVIAAYDKDTKNLVDVSIEEYTFASYQKIKHVYVDMNKDNSDDSLYFKVYMLDGMGTLKPLMESKTTQSVSVE